MEIHRTIWFQGHEYVVIKEYDEAHYHAYRIVSGYLIEFYRYCRGAEFVYMDIPEVMQAALGHMKYMEEVQAREDQEALNFELGQAI
ncbi:hypothetical protein OB236_38470 [Paenibacillus sp. WQ 127069]|uniref:WYL domain-containing protein n=1 Tax=Paenibacillus baimaensis TaxID=2982185 RepID=A0ABT2UW62_9BACL|nr:hypothetical protein [Paenibacillus sp. WQ 127069]MCU6798027.1 hypothetical protein [Paenibacillus sp. WQ 127069]